MSIPQISEAELEVMKVIWEYDRATSAQIIERLSHTDWKPKTIQTLITRLHNKGAINAEKSEGKAFIYSSLISEEDYKEHANTSFLQKLYDGSVQLMLASFIKEKKLSKEELNQLKKILDEEN